MSAHTMPPMSLICEDFLKSMVKYSDSKTINDATNYSNTDGEVLTTRLNGFVNGFGSHSDDENDEMDHIANGDNRVTNGPSSTTVPAEKIRKDLMKKMEELKRNQKSLGISDINRSAPPASIEGEEQKLRLMAMQATKLHFF